MIDDLFHININEHMYTRIFDNVLQGVLRYKQNEIIEIHKQFIQFAYTATIHFLHYIKRKIKRTCTFMKFVFFVEIIFSLTRKSMFPELFLF